MKRTFSNSPKLSFAIQMVFMVLWLSNLAGTESYYIVYALCGLTAFGALIDNTLHGWRLEKWVHVFALTLAALFGGAVTLANYDLFSIVRNPEEVSAGTNAFLNVLNAGLTLAGGTMAAYHVLCCAFHRLPVVESDAPKRKHPGRVFWVAFGIIAVINLLYLFFVVYPGSLSLDSIVQVTQIRDGVYSNHHPYWHTMIIKLFLDIGYALTGDVNGAVACYSVAQILMMAACFAYVVMTLYQARIPMGWILAAFALYTLTPYHIAYSNTMWKDVLFGGAVCVLLTALYRIFRGIGKRPAWNYAALFLGGIGFSLLRSNGFLALLASLLVFLVVLRKRHWRAMAVVALALVCGWVLKNPVLAAKNVTQPDLVESLSIPVQQVARVVADGCQLTEEEEELLSRVVDVEEVPDLYDSGLSDPIKNEIRSKNNAYFEENSGLYLKLWIQLGLKYPGEYGKAWVDQTKGYWGGGYQNWIFGEFIEQNDMGIAMTKQNNILYMLYKTYFTFVKRVDLFQPLCSIGLHVWILVIAAFVNLFQKRKEYLLVVPVIMLVGTLMVATPVYAEFRYAYAVFTTFPLLLPVLLHKPAEE